jgi:hypothetical protein
MAPAIARLHAVNGLGWPQPLHALVGMAPAILELISVRFGRHSTLIVTESSRSITLTCDALKTDR